MDTYILDTRKFWIRFFWIRLDTSDVFFGYDWQILDTIFGYAHAGFWIRLQMVLDTNLNVLDTTKHAQIYIFVVKTR